MFNPAIPATNNAALSDIDLIRQNFLELRKNERAASLPTNPVAGMVCCQSDYPSSGIDTIWQRNPANSAWIELWRSESSIFTLYGGQIKGNVSVPGAFIDGRDPSVDGTKLDTHVHNGSDGTVKISNNDVLKTGAVEVFEDFMFGIVGMNFENLNAGATTITSENGRIRITSDTGASSFGITQLLTKPFKVTANNSITFEIRIRNSTIIPEYQYYGISVDVELNGSGIGFVCEGRTYPIKCRAIAGSVGTTGGSDVYWSASETNVLKFVATTSQILYYINGIYKGTLTTNIPTGYNLGLIATCRGTVDYVDIDYILCTSSARV